MNLKYLSTALLSFPLLPILYYQGKQLRARMPRLPEALGTEGLCGEQSFPTQPVRLLTIGESTIAGVGVATHEEGFTGTLARELSRLFRRNIHWKVYARSGYTATKVLRKVVPAISEEQADLIVIGLGGNDAFGLTRPGQWRKAVRQLIAELQAKYPDAVIVFCNMPPIKEFPAFTSLMKFTFGNWVESLGEELKDLVQRYDRVFYYGDNITLTGWLDRFGIKAELSEFFSDGMHPSPLTYELWARDIAGRIGEEGTIKNIFNNIVDHK